MGSTWAILFKREEEFEISMDSKLTTVPTIPKEWRVTFDIKPTDLNQITSGEWKLQVRDVFSMGSPSVRLIGIFYMLTTNKGLNIQGLVSRNQVFGGKMKELEVNVWTSVEISQELVDGKYIYEVKLDGETYLSAENNATKEFQNVVVKAAENTYGVLPGFMRNLFIEGKGRII